MAYNPDELKLDDSMADRRLSEVAPIQVAAAAPDPMDEYAKSLNPGLSVIQKIKEYFGLTTPEKPKEGIQWGGKPMEIPGRPGYILMPDGRVVGPDGKVAPR